MSGCTLDTMTVDATVHGSLIAVDNYDGTPGGFVPTGYREITPVNVYCDNCGDYLFETDDHVLSNDTITRIVQEHIEESSNGTDV